MYSARLTKWLPLRTSPPHAPPPRPDARPCLPRIEALDDRIMLSATVENGGGGASQTLVALLQGQIPVVTDELALLKADAGAVAQDQKLTGDYHKLTNSIIQFDDSLYDLGDSLLKIASNTKLSDTQITTLVDAEAQKVDAQFLKIKDANADFLKISESSAAVEQTLAGDQGSLVQGLLSAVPVPGSASNDQIDNFLKISDSFQKIDQAIVSLGSNIVIADKSGDKTTKPIETISLNFSRIEFEYVPQISDPALQQTVLGLANQTLALAPSNPGSIG